MVFILYIFDKIGLLTMEYVAAFLGPALLCLVVYLYQRYKIYEYNNRPNRGARLIEAGAVSPINCEN